MKYVHDYNVGIAAGDPYLFMYLLQFQGRRGGGGRGGGGDSAGFGDGGGFGGGFGDTQEGGFEAAGGGGGNDEW